MPWSLLGILLAVCAVACAVGFYKFVYFLSIGYGFAIAFGGIAVLIMALINPTATPLWIILVQTALFIAYGVRLSGFLLIREFKNATFKKTTSKRSGFCFWWKQVGEIRSSVVTARWAVTPTARTLSATSIFAPRGENADESPLVPFHKKSFAICLNSCYFIHNVSPGGHNMKSIYRWAANHPRLTKVIITAIITVFCFWALDPEIFSFFTRFLIVFLLLFNFGVFSRPKGNAYMQLLSLSKKKRKLDKSLAGPPTYNSPSELSEIHQEG